MLPAVRDRILRRRFALERSLLGGDDVDAGHQRSVLLFSIDRSGTELARRALTTTCAAAGLQPVDLASYLAQADQRPLDQLDATAVARDFGGAFRPAGFFYGAFDGMVDGIPGASRYTRILHLRDPRDVLTERYAAAAERRRDAARALGLDAFVLAEVPWIAAKLHGYEPLLADPTTIVSRYEVLATDFPRWLDGVLGATRLPVPKRVRDALVDTHVPAPGKDRSPRHRPDAPGAHTRGLRPETVRALDDALGDLLPRFGYA